MILTLNRFSSFAAATLAVSSLLFPAAFAVADDAKGSGPTSENPATGAAGEQPRAAEKAEPAASAVGRGIFIADFDGDGDLDIDNDGWPDLFIADANAPGGGTVAQRAPLSEYWIGIDGSSPDDALRSQLEIPAGQGILVNQVIADSPAARAGLKAHDVLLTAGERPLGSIDDLSNLVDEKKETTLPIRLIRGGKQITIEVTPQRRPASQTGETCPKISRLDDAKFFAQVYLDLIGKTPDEETARKFAEDQQPEKRVFWVNKLLRSSTTATKSCVACHQDRTAADTSMNWLLRMRSPQQKYWNYRNQLMLPRLGGVVAEPRSGLPEGLSISITRQGQQPAKIVVKQDAQTWEVTEKDYREKLPAEVAAHVATMLGGAAPSDSGSTLPGFWRLYYAPSDDTAHWRQCYNLNSLDSDAANVLRQFRTDASPHLPKPEPVGSAFEKIDKRLESLRNEFGELRKEMLDLREQLRAERTAKPGSPEEKK